MQGVDSKEYGRDLPQDENPYNWLWRFATSGVAALWGDNVEFPSVYAATSRWIALPADKTAYLHFSHIYDFGDGDGGVLEVQASTDPPGTWNDALFHLLDNGYPGKIEAGTANPLAGRPGYFGKSNGYISSRMSLGAFKGKSVRFRFRIGNDGTGKHFGWAVDDVRVYTCPSACAPAVSVQNQSFHWSGGSGTVTVTAPPGCRWTPAGHAPWISVPSGVFSGSRTVTYFVGKNSDPSSRSSYLTAGGTPVTINQEGFISLGEALDNTTAVWDSWSKDFNDWEKWFGQSEVFRFGGSAGRSGPIGDDKYTAMESMVEGPGYLSFYWKVSSEPGYDFLVFLIDDVEQERISGEVDWQRRIYHVYGGTHFYQWKYLKDSSWGAGADAGWVDKMETGPCYYVLSSETAAFSDQATVGTIGVTAPAGCTWGAQSQVPWITAPPGVAGSGSGTLTFQVASNAGGTTRTGTVNVADQILTVTQWGAISLGDAVDNPFLTWTSGGDAPWKGQPNVYYVDHDAARSGTIGDQQVSWIETAVEGPVMGELYWKVSSRANQDFLRFLIDGVEQITYVNNAQTPLRISGEADWDEITFAVGPGNHALRWAYTKDGSGSAGADGGWLDGVCLSLVNASQTSFSSSGGTASAGVSMPGVCSWTATSFASWMTITSGKTGTGNGTVAFTVAPYSGSGSRTGMLYIAGRDVWVTQHGIPCGYSLSPADAYFNASGGTDTLSVSAPQGCSWTASTNSPLWIVISPPSGGSGNGTMTYTVSANLTASVRTGTITVADKILTVHQLGNPCSTSVQPTSAPFSSGAGSGSVSVSAGRACSWTAQSRDGWIEITSGVSGTGSGTVYYDVLANSSTEGRTGHLLVAGQIVTVTQEGISCTFDLDSTAGFFPGAGGAGQAGVTSILGCTWSAASNAPWITVTSGPNYTGSYVVTFSVASNPGAWARTGTMTLAGKTYTVTQSGGDCTAAISPEGGSFPAGGGDGAFQLEILDGCGWRSNAGQPWIHLTSGVTGTGKGEVTFTVDPNPETGAREGTVSTAGRSFTVLQEGQVDGLAILLPRTGQSAVYGPGDDGEAKAGLSWPVPEVHKPRRDHSRHGRGGLRPDDGSPVGTRLG